MGSRTRRPSFPPSASPAATAASTCRWSRAARRRRSPAASPEPSRERAVPNLVGCPAVSDAFYIPRGDDRFEATPHTSGPWDPGLQHAGPPAALLARALERHEPRAELMISRVTFEILHAVPVAELRVTARTARPGRSVELLEAS